jgi:uncharacterized protein
MTMTATALSDDEMDFLETFLLSGATPETAMPFGVLDGYLTAIALNPDLIPPSRWMPWVWDMQAGEATPEFESIAQAEQVMGLLMRHYNNVLAAVNAGEPDPVFMQGMNDGVTVVEPWATGFMGGVTLFAEPWWEEVLQKQPDLLSLFLLFGSDEGGKIIGDLPEDAEDLKSQAPHALMPALEDLCDYFAPLRLEAARARIETHRRTTPKVGRNDPCPCGSGRKFKKCCGREPAAG